MSAWSEAFNELVLAVQPTLDPVLTKGDGTTADDTKELDAILLASAKDVWASGTFTFGQIVSPTTRNGHIYRVIQGGSSTTEPTWPLDIEGQVTSGTVIFEEAGTDSDSIYDLRRAKYEAWNLKTAKAASKNQVISDGRGQAASYLYLNCVRERDKYRSVSVV